MKRASLSVCLLILVSGISGGSTADTMRFACAGYREPKVVSESLKLLTLNVSHGRNTAVNQVLVGKERTYENLDRIAELLTVAAPDVVALQEADAPSRWSGGFDHVKYLAERANYPCVVHGLHSESWMSTFGTALLSRAELLEPASIQFVPSPPSARKGYVRAKLVWQTGIETRLITVVSVHFDFLSRKTRDSQVTEMVAGLSQIDGPLVVLGDVNSEWHASESHVQRLANELKLYAFEPDSDGLGSYKKSTGKRLDWILISRDLVFKNYKVLSDIVADHFAVYAEVTLREVLE